MATPRHRSLPLPGRASFRVAVVVVAVAATVGWGQAPPVQARPADAVRSVIPAPGSATSSPDTAVTIVTDPGVSIDTVSVSGSRSGDHTGELTYAREGTVSTFDPDEAFAAGETVTVSTTTTDRAHAPMSWDFVVGTPAPHHEVECLAEITGPKSIAHHQDQHD